MRMLTTAVAAVLALGPLFAPTSDDPGPNPPPGVPGHREFLSITSYVEYLGKRENQVDYNLLLGKCIPDTPRQRCQLTRSDGYTREVSAEFGATVEAVSASINISESQQVTIQVGCLSPDMAPTEEYVAYPTETRYYYRVITETADQYYDYGIFVPGERSESPVAYTAVYDKGVRCSVRPQPPS